MAEVTARDIARKLAESRQKVGWTLATASAHAGVSVAHLSRIESAKRQPSIGLLIQLARAYRLPLGQLVGEEPQTAHHVIRGEQVSTHESPDGRYSALSGILGTNLLEAIRLDLRPHASTSADSRHDGEEWLYVISGAIQFTQAGSVNELGSGDAVHLNSQIPHHLSNPTDEQASIILVSASAKPGQTNAHTPLGPPEAISARSDGYA